MIDLSIACFIMDEINAEMRGSFTVSWLVPSAAISDMKKSIRNVCQSFFQKYKITSLTLNGLWLFLSESEIDAVWSHLHVSDRKLKDQFHTMYEQIVYELKVGNVSEHQLSLYCRESLQLQSDHLSQVFLKQEFPAYFVNFRILATVIEGFGSDCLKSTMRSYCKYMSIFAKQLHSS